MNRPFLLIKFLKKIAIFPQSHTARSPRNNVCDASGLNQCREGTETPSRGH